MERERTALEFELAKSHDRITENDLQLKERMGKLEQREIRKYEIEKELFNRSLLEKNEYIGKLEKEVRSLSAMLSYWKPLDEGQG